VAPARNGRDVLGSNHMRDLGDVTYDLGLFETLAGYARRDVECKAILTATQGDFMPQQK
jgi:hypothetical protein